MKLARQLAVPLAIFALALGVRMLGLTWGLPNAERWYSYHPDESLIAGAVSDHLNQGDFNPHFFNYPSLSIYATWFIYQIMAGFGFLTSVPNPAPPFPWNLLRDIILAGRIFSVLCGAGTALCIWGAVRELGGRKSALLAGVLMALTPAVVQHSHFATVDVPTTFFVALCLLLTLRAFNVSNPTKLLLGAAFVAGLATGTKYNAILVMLAPLVASFLTSQPRSTQIKIGVGIVALAFVGFFLSTPYALLAPSDFWGSTDPNKQQGFAYELLVHPRSGSGELFGGTGKFGWLYHLTFNLPFVLTWPLLIAGIAGAVRLRKERKYWPLLAFAAVYFVAIGFSNVRFMRYTFFLVPPLLIWASILAARLPKPAIWGTLLTVFALLGTTDVLRPLLSPDNRDLAADALKGNALVGTPNKPWFYTAPFQPEGFNSPPRFQHPIQDVVIPLDSSTLTIIQKSPPPAFVMNQYEVTDKLRLHPDGYVSQFMAELDKSYNQKQTFEFKAILPGRTFQPHDYLYTHPTTWVWTQPQTVRNTP